MRYINYIFRLAFIFILSLSFNTVNSQQHCKMLTELSLQDQSKCGSIKVPETHDDPNGKQIDFAYIVLKSTDETSEHYPMIYFTGGPGASSLFPGSVQYWSMSPIRKTRDIIIIDQRGIGYSSGLPNMNEDLAKIFAQDASEEQERLLIREIMIRHKTICESKGISLEHYTTEQSAKDVGILMKHLGYDKYNLYGASYGTRLARVVQDLFPEFINSVVLNSPNSFEEDFIIDRIKNFSSALEKLFTYCENDTDCRSKYPNLKADYLNAIQSIKENPLKLEVNNKEFIVNAQDALFLLRRKIYAPDAKTSFPPTIQEYLNGGGPITKSLIVADFADWYNFTMWLSFERNEAHSKENTAQVINDLYANQKLLPSSIGVFTSLYLELNQLHEGELPEHKKVFKTSSIPTMIMVNQYDPVTPPKNGHEMMKGLTNGQLFILDEAGHGGGDLDCRNKIMTDFMNEPTKALDVCLNLFKE